MFTLLIDTHSNDIHFALYKNEILEKKITISEQKDHSAICIPSLIKFLEEQKITVHDINDIVVVNGPGSFTGVRIGVTIAKTLAMSLNILIRTITSLELYGNFTEDTFIAMEEKNGYFIGKWHVQTRNIDSYRYLTKGEFEKFKQNNNIIIPENIDYENLMKNAHKKEAQNAHAVNPFYVKKIEAEK